MSSFLACSASASPRRIRLSVRFRPVRPTSLDSSISRISARRSGGHFSARSVHAALQTNRLAFERVQALDGLAHDIDQALALARIEADRANQQRHLNSRARQLPLGAHHAARFQARVLQQSRGLLAANLKMLFDLADDAQRLPRALFDDLVGQLFLIELHDVLDRARALAQLLARSQKILEHDGRAGNRLEYDQLAALNALGERDFALALQQRRRTHLAQVQADRVLGLRQRARR